jgi:hypothetical protein
MKGLHSILFSLLMLCILTFSLVVSAGAKPWVYWGNLGDVLECRIDTEAEPIVGTNLNITFTFKASDIYNVQVDFINFRIDGAGVTFPSSLGYFEGIANNVTISAGSTITASYTVKPTEEGDMVCVFRTQYNATSTLPLSHQDRPDEYAQGMIVLYARILPFGVVLLLFITFVSSTLVLSVLLVYVLRKYRIRSKSAKVASITNA